MLHPLSVLVGRCQLQLLAIATIAHLATASSVDLEGYWAAETASSPPLPSVLICLRFTKIKESTKITAKFHEIRKLSWAEPSERSVSISLRGPVVLKQMDANEYPKPNGALNFTVATPTFRYAEPSDQIGILTQQTAALAKQQRACVYAWGGAKTDDKTVLRMRCFPEDTISSSLSAVLGFGAPPVSKQPTLVAQAGKQPTLFKKDRDGACVLHHSKRFIKSGVIRPVKSGYVIWIQLAAVLSAWTDKDTQQVVQDLAEYHALQPTQLSVVSVSAGSVVLQMQVSRVQQANPQLLASAQKMQTEVLDGLVTLGGSVVLMVELEWYSFLLGHSKGNSIPGWSVTVLLLSGSLWLCWVAYTVQCRRMVLELEEKYSEEATYQRLPRGRPVDVDNNPVSGY